MTSSQTSTTRPALIMAALTSPVCQVVRKYRDHRRKQREISRRDVTERELHDIQKKIAKMLFAIDHNQLTHQQVNGTGCVTRTGDIGCNSDNTASHCHHTLTRRPSPQECVICLNAKATMRTEPCGHQVVCRHCFLTTIQAAVTQRVLPLKCVLCRTPIIKLSSTDRPSARSYLASPASGKLTLPPGHNIAIGSFSCSNRRKTAAIAAVDASSGEVRVEETRRKCKWTMTPLILDNDNIVTSSRHQQQQQVGMVPYLALGSRCSSNYDARHTKLEVSQ